MQKFYHNFWGELLTQMWYKENKCGCQLMNSWDIAQIICVHMHVGKIWSFYHKYGWQMCNIGHITFTFEDDLTITQVNLHAKNEDAASRHWRGVMLTDNSKTIASPPPVIAVGKKLWWKNPTNNVQLCDGTLEITLQTCHIRAAVLLTTTTIESLSTSPCTHATIIHCSLKVQAIHLPRK